MCGIVGIISHGSERVDPADLHHLMDLVAHRGPDGSGSWFSPNHSVGLGHRRLAIIDPSEGAAQPMITLDGRYVIVYNGEVYNFLELRRELEAVGRVFKTESDTEVILAAWQEWGEGMLPRFNGMWALAIFDTLSGELFMARDRFGIKPLLYSATPERFIFASEMRALLHSGLITKSLQVDVARRMLFDPFGIEGSESTLFSQIRRLQGGHCMRLRHGRVEIRRWWNTSIELPEVPTLLDDQVDQFRSLFRDAVKLRMRSDVPIGTCLSGGFDSSAVICTMADIERLGPGARSAKAWRHAFVASFPGMSNDESPEAEIAADWAGVTPSTLNLGNENAIENIEQILDDFDDVYISLPSAVWQLYKQLRSQKVLVSLDGHGADELMGGYRQDGRAIAFHLRNLIANCTSGNPLLGRSVDLARAVVFKGRGQYFLRGKLVDLPEALPLVGDDDNLPDEWGGLNRRLYHMFHGTVLPTILRNFDRLSMAHGIEVRMPFMDWRLVAYTMALPDISKNNHGYSKLVARQAMVGQMPESIRMGKRKVGFNSPMPEWLNGPLSDWIRPLLDLQVPAYSELVDEDQLRLSIQNLTQRKMWTWESVGRIWPYLHLKWILSRI